MSEKWKDIFIIFMLGTICILAFITVVDILLLNVKILNIDPFYTVFASIVGGLVSGGITFLGVKLTLRNDKNIMIANYSREETYKYIDELNKLNFCMKIIKGSIDYYKNITDCINEIEDYETYSKEVDAHYNNFKETSLNSNDYFSNSKHKYQLDIENYELLLETESKVKFCFSEIEGIYRNHLLSNAFDFDGKDFSFVDAKIKLENIYSILEIYKEKMEEKLELYKNEYNKNKLI